MLFFALLAIYIQKLLQKKLKLLKEYKMKKTNFFSLIELLIVITIIGILALMIVPQITDLSGEAEDAVSTYNARAIASQLELFKAANGRYPSKFYTGFEGAGVGTGCVSAESVYIANGEKIAGQTAPTPVTVSEKLSNNVKMNLKRGIQVAINGPVTGSLAKAGISRLAWGDPTVMLTVPTEDNSIWNMDLLHDSELLMWSNYDVAFNPSSGTAGVIAVNSWLDANGNEIVLGGRTIPQYIQQGIMEDNVQICQVVALVVGPQVDWSACYDDHGKCIKGSKVRGSAVSQQRPETYCVAFFATSTFTNRVNGVPSAQGAKPAFFLGCVNADGTVK